MHKAENNLFKYELTQIQAGTTYIAGIDEVGRGCLAGPMVVCAIILNSKDLNEIINTPIQALRNNDVSLARYRKNTELNRYLEITDSKRLTAKKRRELSEFIKQKAISFSIIEITPQQIDTLGISKCTQISFESSINKLTIKPEHILTDAFKIKSIEAKCQTNIIKGDQKSITIAAASIIAKTYRDKLMENLSNLKKYEKYGFEKHKGYGTKLHLQTLKMLGPTDIHRKSFRPVTEALSLFNNKEYNSEKYIDPSK